MAIDVKALPSQLPAPGTQTQGTTITRGRISLVVNPHDHAYNSTECGAQCPICTGVCGLASKHPGNHVCNLNSTHTWPNTDIPGPHP